MIQYVQSSRRPLRDHFEGETCLLASGDDGINVAYAELPEVESEITFTGMRNVIAPRCGWL
jgi:hypothetical protein